MDDPKPSSPTPPRAISPLHTDYRPTMFDTHETKMFDVILQTASRLLFSDGFQQQIIDAIHAIHSQLRPTLRLEGTDETMRSIDASCNLLMKTLTGWSQRQRSLCDSISRVNLEALRYVLPANFETHTEVMDELRTIFRSLRTVSGCEVNFRTISLIKDYFSVDIGFFFVPIATTHHDVQHLSPADRQARVCFQRLGDAIHEAKATAHWLLDDVTEIWEEFSKPTTIPGLQMADTRCISNVPQIAVKGSQEIETQPEKMPRKRLDKAKQKLGTIFSHFKKVDKQMSRDHNTLPVISAPSNVVHTSGFTKPGASPFLDTLPEAPLSDLELWQIGAQQRHSTMKQSPQKNSEIGAAFETTIRHKVLGLPDFIKNQDHMSNSTHDDKRDSHSEATRTDSVIGTTWEHDDGETDPEAIQSFWRHRALEDLERGN
ncbi:hypothetical protein IWZ01DRAFT_477492 [Phyllosticta capitalensis]